MHRGRATDGIGAPYQPQAGRHQQAETQARPAQRLRRWQNRSISHRNRARPGTGTNRTLKGVAGQSQACPFDLQALVPVPTTMLQRGPDDATALAWLWQHWGTTQALRHVSIDAAAEATARRALARGEEIFVVTFWSADWTPWRALAQ